LFFSWIIFHYRLENIFIQSILRCYAHWYFIYRITIQNKPLYIHANFYRSQVRSEIDFKYLKNRHALQCWFFIETGSLLNISQKFCVTKHLFKKKLYSYLTSNNSFKFNIKHQIIPAYHETIETQTFPRRTFIKYFKFHVKTLINTWKVLSSLEIKFLYMLHIFCEKTATLK
jgi:hypothetical protein